MMFEVSFQFVCVTTQQFPSGYLSEEIWNTNFKRCARPLPTAALRTAAEIWKQPQRPSPGRWVEKMQRLSTREYSSAVKQNASYHSWRRGRTWRVLCSVESVRQRKANTMRFHLHVESIEQNEQTKQKKTRRYKKQTGGSQRMEIWGLGEKGEGTRQHRRPVINQAWGCAAQHRERSW